MRRGGLESKLRMPGTAHELGLVHPKELRCQADKDLTVRGIGWSHLGNDVPSCAHQTETGVFPSEALLDRTYTQTAEEEGKVCFEPSAVIGAKRRALDLGVWSVNDDAFSQIASTCHDLRVLQLAGATGLSTRCLASFATRARDRPSTLRHVDLGGWKASEVEVNTGLAILVTSCGTSLRSLELSGTSLSDRGLRVIAERCVVLEHINVSECQAVTDEGISALVTATRRDGLNKTDTVLAKSCKLVRGHWFLVTSHDRRATLAVSGISRVNLSGCPLVCDSAVTELVLSCGPHLADLNISGCTKLTDTFLGALGANAPALKKLGADDLPRITDEGILRFCDGVVRKLEEVSVQACAVTDLGLAALCESFHGTLKVLCARAPGLASLAPLKSRTEKLAYGGHRQRGFHNLRKLHESHAARVGAWTEAVLSASDTRVEAPGVWMLDDRGTEPIKLEKVSLTGHVRFDMSNLAILVQATSETLLELELSKCARLDDEAVSHLSERCSKLCVLNVAQCPLLGDDALQKICRNLGNLRELDVSRANDPEEVDRISDLALSRLLVHPALEVLSLCFRKSFTGRFIGENSFNQPSESAKHPCTFTRLRRLDLAGCTKVRTGGLQRLLQACSSLEFVGLEHCVQLSHQDAAQAVALTGLRVAPWPKFSLEKKRDSQVARRFASRFALEICSASTLQRAFRRFVAAPITLDYILIRDKALTESSAVFIQRMWRTKHAANLFVEFKARTAASRVIQRMIRAHRWRVSVRRMTTDMEAKRRRERLAGDLKLQDSAAKRAQDWYRRFLWLRSVDGRFHLELVEQAQNELMWRKRTKEWKDAFSAICIDAALSANRRTRLHAGLVQGGFDANFWKVREDRAPKLEALPASALAEPQHPLRRTNASRGWTSCVQCSKRKASVWCALCRKVLCSTCCWQDPAHGRHVHTRNDPNFDDDLIQDLAPELIPQVDSDRFDLAKVARSMLSMDFALGEAKTLISLRALLLAELKEVFAKRARQAEQQENERRKEEHDRLVNSVVFVQGVFRRNRASRAFSSVKARQKALELKQTKNHRAAAAVKVQALMRGFGPRKLWRSIVSQVNDPSAKPLAERQRVVQDTFRAFWRKLEKWRGLALRQDVSCLRAKLATMHAACQGDTVAQALKWVKGVISKVQGELSQIREELVMLRGASDENRMPLNISICKQKLEHRKQLLEDAQRLEAVVSTQIGPPETERSLRLNAMEATCQNKTDLAMRNIERLLKIQSILECRRENLMNALQDPGNVEFYSKGCGNPKLAALSSAKQATAARCELSWVSHKLGHQTMAQMQQASEESAIEALSTYDDRNVPCELKRYWEEVVAVATFELEHLRSSIQFEEERTSALKDIISLHKFAFGNLEEMLSLHIRRARCESSGDHKLLLLLSTQEHGLHERVLNMQEQIKNRTTGFLERSRVNDRRLDAITIPVNKRDTDTFKAVLPMSCQVPHKISVKRLFRELKVQAWTALLPSRFFTDPRKLAEDEALKARLQSTANARVAANEIKPEDEDLSDSEQDLRSEDRDQGTKDEEIAGNSGALAMELLREARSGERSTAAFRFGLGPLRDRIVEWWKRDQIELEKMEEAFRASEQAKSKFLLLGISRDLRFSFGKREMEDFEAEQTLRSQSGMPVYVRVAGNFGSENPIYLWYSTTTEPEEFIFDLSFSHASKQHELHRATAAGQSRVTHDKMMGKGRAPALQLVTTGLDGFQKIHGDNPLRFVKELRLAVGGKGAESAEGAGFSKVGIDLRKFGLAPDTFLYALWKPLLSEEEPMQGASQQAPKGRTTNSSSGDAETVETLEARKAELDKLVLEDPSKRAEARKVLLSLDDQIIKARKEKEAERASLLKSAVDFLAISKRDLRRLLQLFARMDTDGSGEVSVTEFCSFAEIEEGDFALRVFRFLDSDSDGSLDFAEFVHLLATLCMFGNQDLAKMCFRFIPADSKGNVLGMNFERMLAQMHGIDPNEVPVLRHAVEHCNKNVDEKGFITVDVLLDSMRAFPGAYFPVIQLRDRIRDKFLGQKWWERKLIQYSKVRQKLRNERLLREKKLEIKREEFRKMKEAEGRQDQGDDQSEDSDSHDYESDSHSDSEAPSSSVEKNQKNGKNKHAVNLPPISRPTSRANRHASRRNKGGAAITKTRKL